LNNTVQNPTIDNLVAATINVTYNSFSLEMNNTDNSGKFVVVKEGANQILTDLPSDNVYYTVNESFGIGSALDGGHVVYSGDGLIADISGLSPVQDYTVFVFEYNNNEPDNTVINYSDDYLSLQLKTSTSVFLLQEFGIIEFEEDTETEVILNTYINDIGSNSYTITSSNDNILAENIDGNITFSSSENFFGESTITVAVVNDYEQTQFDFLIKVTPINDAPILSEVADLVTYELITSEFELVISDVDNANSELSFNVSSSDEMVVEISSINIQLLENIFVLSLTPSNYGISEIGIEVSDGELINAKKFRYTVEEVVGIEGLTEVNIYPNPVQNYINVIGKNENSEYVIYDIYGRELMTDFVRNSLIDISELKSGRYILKIEGNTNQFIKE